MRRLGRTVAAAAVLALAACSSPAPESPAPESPAPGSPPPEHMSPEARGYLSEALDLIQQKSLNTAKVDWPKLRTQAFAQAATARTPADTHTAIRAAVTALDDHHSRFYPPDQAANVDADPEAVNAPTTRQLPGRIAQLTLPAVNGSEHTYAEYVTRGRAAVAAVAEVSSCGWVVDLRGETGGGMWAPLAVAAPILGDGPLGAFVTADGTRSTWSVRDGVPYLDDAPQASPATRQDEAPSHQDEAPTHHDEAPETPVAVLAGRATGSAGEAVAIAFIGRPATRSFGQPTYGVPTGNAAHRLSDGAVLLLTGAAEADRTGRVHEGPIEPDEPVETADPRKDDDPALAAAVTWLSGQAPCKAG
ncbi:S41 family peptidase [Kitasatospora sp. NBC_01300]|uniref:S41 family peptidase n=1 Tax=Kitasatospora sp. NBC_01300 TaxID=2903574 RepID=UPI00352F299C|nr:S41 family peptidase [Kitasatospora sp. NBC_01300]